MTTTATQSRVAREMPARPSRRLDEYRRRRRFGSTPEPRGARSAPDTAPRFVVQLHQARHRHFDLRLEIGGTLRSWAVPRGPSRDPQTKRLAVQVEDHPLEYGSFEGDIPPGHYGAGSVWIWDRGYWQPEGDPARALAQGRLGFTLYGERLRGRWTLVRTGAAKASARARPQWLLIKAKDSWVEADDVADDRPLSALKAPAAMLQAAGPEGAALVLPDSADLQLAVLGHAPPQGDGWLHELKYDGYRMLMQRSAAGVRLTSRNGIDWTSRLPHLASALLALRCDSVVLDAELVALDAHGRSDFGRLQTMMGSNGATTRALAFAFDLLHLDGRDLRKLPQLQRKERLAHLLPREGGTLRATEYIVGHGSEAYAAACAQQFEGIVSKDSAATYVAGRSDRWRKIKCLTADDFVVVGYTLGKGSRRELGALLLATPDGDGGWRYAGRVGSGFSEASLRSLLARLKPARAPVALAGTPDPADLGGAKLLWVRPESVVEVRYRGVTARGLLRHASYRGLRPDKSAKELRPLPIHDTPGPTPMLPTDLPITHPERRVFDTPPITKGEVAAYYARLANCLLREVRGRPISLLRCPDGIGGTCFFQRHRSTGFPPDVHETQLQIAGRSTAHVIHIEDVRGLIALVQMGVVEIHAWGASLATPDRPDRVVFDLDPGAGVSWPRIVAAARAVRARLHAVGLRSFVRTSGGKGLHVVAPLQPHADWRTVKAFARALAQTFAQTQPDEFVAVAGAAKRRNRIFIDYLRNSWGASSVVSFSLRARPGAGVATPLRWSELSRVDSATQYHYANLERRLSRLQSDPWTGYDTLRQSLPKIGDAR